MHFSLWLRLAYLALGPFGGLGQAKGLSEPRQGEGKLYGWRFVLYMLRHAGFSGVLMDRAKMRNLYTIWINENIEREYRVTTENGFLINSVFSDITHLIFNQDNLVTSRMGAEELADYMHVEVYVALAELLASFPTEEDHLHLENNCPVCRKIDQIRFIMEYLLQQWHNLGTFDRYSKSVYFRFNAQNPERVIN